MSSIADICLLFKAALAKWNKTKPSANGIIDVQTGSQLVSPPAATPKKRGRPRKSIATPAAQRIDDDDGSLADDDDAIEVDKKPKKAVKASAKKPTGTAARKSKSVPMDLSQVADSDGEDDKAVLEAAPKRPRGRPPKSAQSKPSTPAPSTSTSKASKSITPSWVESGGQDALAALDERAQSMMAKAKVSGEKRKKVTDVKDEGEDAEVEEPKPKKYKSKASRRSSGFSSGGESGFSDANPFQSGTEQTPPDKKSRRKVSADS